MKIEIINPDGTITYTQGNEELNKEAFIRKIITSDVPEDTIHYYNCTRKPYGFENIKSQNIKVKKKNNLISKFQSFARLVGKE